MEQWTTLLNKLHCCDCLDLMDQMPDECIDLIYIDPPYFSQRDYCTKDGDFAFSDKWDSLKRYLEWLNERLHEMRWLLKPTGSLFVHLDRHACHYVKVALDNIYGSDHFVNEIIWHYTGGGRSKRYFSHKHNTIFWYAKGLSWTFNIDAMRVPYKETSGYAKGGITSTTGKKYNPNPLGTPVDDVWDIPIINPLAKERIGYPTQKPESLLQRIIEGCSNRGDIVADFFCGSGTTPAVAQRLNRRWIACDDSKIAIEMASERIK